MPLTTNGAFTPTDEWGTLGNYQFRIDKVDGVTVVDPGYDPIQIQLLLANGITISASYTVNEANTKPLTILALQYSRDVSTGNTEPPPPAPPPGGGSSPRS
jgi:hypothetical protein